jgi:hypothetical protein
MKEAALSHLEKAIELGWIDYRAAQLDPRFDGLRGSVEFQQAVTRVSTTVRGLRAEAVTKYPQLESKSE